MTVIKDVLIYLVLFTGSIFVTMLSWSIADDSKNKVKRSLMYSIAFTFILIASYIAFSALGYAITGGVSE